MRSLGRRLLLALLLGMASSARPLQAAEGGSFCVLVPRANVRTCPSLDCPVIKIKSQDDPIQALYPQSGEAVAQDPTWYAVEVLFRSQPGFMHGSVLGPCGAAPMPAARDELPPLAERVAHGATVAVLVTRGDGSVVQATGTVVGQDGLTFLTSFHVVGNPHTGSLNAASIRVGPYLGWTLDARVVAVERRLDLALLRVAYPRGLFSVVPLGDSDFLGEGDVVHVLSYPGEGMGSLLRTSGRILGHYRLQEYAVPLLVTDASAGLGSSGGVAVNSLGEAVGIVTGLVVSPSGLARLGAPGRPQLTLLVPINAALPLVSEGQRATTYYTGLPAR